MYFADVCSLKILILIEFMLDKYGYLNVLLIILYLQVLDIVPPRGNDLYEQLGFK